VHCSAYEKESEGGGGDRGIPDFRQLCSLLSTRLWAKSKPLVILNSNKSSASTKDRGTLRPAEVLIVFRDVLCSVECQLKQYSEFELC
jgi:hypothetical protein